MPIIRAAIRNLRAPDRSLDEASRFAERLVRIEGTRLLADLRPRRAVPKTSPDDPVTAQDLAVERRILAAIAARHPDDGRIGEETGASRSDSPFTWVVDPIDGTSNFASGIPLFAVSIALLQDGRPVAGAAFSALDRASTRAFERGGAWRKGRRLRLGRHPAGSVRLVGVNPARGARPGLPRLVPEVGKIRRLGSAVLHFLCVAGGGFVACLDERARCWDLAAASLIVREAGGVVLRMDGTPLLRFDLSAEGLSLPVPCVAGTAGWAERLLGRVGQEPGP